MRFAYADPPYVGLAHHYVEKTEVDHAVLIARLCGEFPDGWVLSCHSPALRELLPLAPADARVGAWVKPWCSFKPGIKPAYAWEPVIFRGGRKRPPRSGPSGRDWVSASSSPRGKDLIGAKPPAFCVWVLDLLNFQPGDEFVDLYPGTGVMTRAAAAHGRATITGPLFGVG